MRAKKPEPEISRHHVFFERRDYRRRNERNFRNHSGFVVALPNDVHKYLHAIVEPPPKPMAEEMIECVNFVEQRDTYEHHTDYWALDAAMQYFVYRGASHPEHEERCRETRLNIARQIGVMAGRHTMAEVIELRPQEAA